MWSRYRFVTPSWITLHLSLVSFLPPNTRREKSRDRTLGPLKPLNHGSLRHLTTCQTKIAQIKNKINVSYPAEGNNMLKWSQYGAKINSLDKLKLSFCSLQQVQPANNRPVYVPSPHPPSHKEFTLYFSGKNPGEITTKVTALPVDKVWQVFKCL